MGLRSDTFTRIMLILIAALACGILIFLIFGGRERYEIQTAKGREVIKLDRRTGKSWRLFRNRWEEIVTRGEARRTPPAKKEARRAAPPAKREAQQVPLAREEARRAPSARQEARRSPAALERFKSQGFQEVGGGFLVGKVRYERQEQAPASLIGEIANASSRSYPRVYFDWSVFDESGTEIAGGRLSVNRIEAEGTRPFRADLGAVDPRTIARYQVRYQETR